MECPNCHQPAETGAAFCGNCGQALNVGARTEAYALAAPLPRVSENQALLSILFGAVGLAGSLFMALAGLAFGIAGLVLGTVSRPGTKRSWSTAGIILSGLSLAAGLGVWTYAYNHAGKAQTAKSMAGPTIVANGLSTPCYSLGFVDKLNISNAQGSCDMRAFNGQTVDSSTDAYKVYASQSPITDAGSFTTLAKNALEKDVKTNLPTFGLASEQVSSFAGSPGYTVVAADKTNGVTVAEEAVFHKAGSGDNIFILVHAVTGPSSNFRDLEAQWQWK